MKVAIKNLLIIGAGQMGQALARAFIKGPLAASALTIYDSDQAKAAAFAKREGCSYLSPDQLGQAQDFQIILLAVKPQHFMEAYRQISTLAGEALIISIIAGKTIADLRKAGFTSNMLAIVMPNTPALVGDGVSAISFSDNCDEGSREICFALFDSCGSSYEVGEELMAAVTGLSGSGPAYMMLVLEALADGAVRQGLPRQMALEMAAMTMYGSAKLFLETGLHPAVLKDQVSSPAGTTIEAIAGLEGAGLRSALIEAVAASAQRARELSKE